jgi:hypothetical protein
VTASNGSPALGRRLCTTRITPACKGRAEWVALRFAWSLAIESKKRGHSKFLFLFSVALVVLGLRLNQAEPPYEKPNQLNRRAFLD